MSSISDAIAEWQQKRLSGSALMREIVSYKKWSVPISDAAVEVALQEKVLSGVMFNKDAQGVSRLFLFSDGPAYNRFCEVAGEANTGQQNFLTTTGSWLFKLPLDTIDMICIDPFTPPDINYRTDQYVRLREMAEAVEVEETIAALRAGENTHDGMVKLVRDYASYSIVIHKLEDKYSLALAPDPQGRALAAVFTFDDAFDAYYPVCKQMYPEGELLQLPMTGKELFAHLWERDLTGMVFNCSGPGKPIAFAAQFSEVVLNAE